MRKRSSILPPGRNLPVLGPDELARYSRHILLDEVGLEGQRRLAAARVLVIGAGGLGSPAALYLAAAGVGTLGLADFDKVEIHNLQRQILHDSASVNEPKTRSGQKRLAALNPHVTIRTHDAGISAGNARQLFSEYDLIVDGSDNFPTRYLNNDAAALEGKPLVYGSIYRFEGQVSVLAPSLEAPCYRCLFPEPPAPGTVPNCGEAGVMGALCGVIGSLQTLEAIKLITGAGEPLLNRLLVYDALNQSFRTLKIKRDPACPLCGDTASIRAIDASRYDFSCEPNQTEQVPESDSVEMPLEVPVEEAARRLESDGAFLLDIREPYEREICAIEGSGFIPMRDVPANLDRVPRDRDLLVLCHHGGRSRQVTAYLRSHGIPRAANVAGGIDAWAARIDPTLRRY